MTTTLLLLRPDGDARLLLAELARRGTTGTIVARDGAIAVVVSGSVRTAGLPEVADVLVSESGTPRVDEAPDVVTVAGARFGGGVPIWIAGPCAVESPEVTDAIAAQVSAAGASLLRGGAYKPRTSPYAFQGLGPLGLRILRDAADRHGLGVVTEAMSESQVPLVADFADMIQIGSRSMQHFPLLRAAGRTGKPVLLKRGASATVEEWLLAAEYVLEAGSAGVVLCERGIRTFSQPTRYTLDLGSVAWVLEHARLPVVVDPSHAAGRSRLVRRLARAAIAVGAHGVMVEVHEDPGCSASDAPQALTTRAFHELVEEVRTDDFAGSRASA